MKKPTATEIVRARERTNIDAINKDYINVMELMKCWDGVGWHDLDLYIGIIVGLQLAEDRANKDAKKESEWQTKIKN